METKAFANAKINLMLHVTGRRADGYHTLNTLIGFTDIGDEITFKPADNYALRVTGPFAAQVPVDERNLVTRAVRAMELASGKSVNMELALTKNIPAGAGLGGGSADAACVMHALNDAWGKPFSLPQLQAVGLSLGAELPVCLAGGAQWVEGIGEKIMPATLPRFDAVVVWPGKALGTVDVFRVFAKDFSEPMSAPSDVAVQNNDLTDAAVTLQPVIRSVLSALSSQTDCAWARMSGSGSACFGIFRDAGSAKKAAAELAAAYSDWWVKPCVINP
jgi:4-diphosphocytidyl-2-C-methyl-D-erythritol kinase